MRSKYNPTKLHRRIKYWRVRVQQASSEEKAVGAVIIGFAVFYWLCIQIVRG